MRVGVYCDMRYRRDEFGAISTRRAFVLLLAALADEVEEVVLAGRLDAEPGRDPYTLPRTVSFAALPPYRDGTAVGAQARSLRRSLDAWDRVLDRVDVAWIFGPHPLAVAFAHRTRRRGVPLVLGVRQNYPAYIAARLPSRSWAWAVPVAQFLDAAFRAQALRSPAVVLGSQLARRYRRSPALLETGFSLVSERDVVAPEVAIGKSWETDRTIVSVTRLDQEKNPLLLVDVLASLRRADSRWRMTIAGDGPLRSAIAERAGELGVLEAIRLPGEVPNGPALWDEYRSAHAFLHSAWTEGKPQVLAEAHAAGIPVVASDVGGVREALAGGTTGLLYPAGDVGGAASHLRALAADADLRARLIGTAHSHLRGETREAQLERIARFLGTCAGGGA